MRRALFLLLIPLCAYGGCVIGGNLGVDGSGAGEMASAAGHTVNASGAALQVGIAGAFGALSGLAGALIGVCAGGAIGLVLAFCGIVLSKPGEEEKKNPLRLRD